MSGFGDNNNTVSSNVSTSNNTLKAAVVPIDSFGMKQKKRNKSGGSEDIAEGAMGCFGVCLGPSISNRKKSDKKNKN